MQEKNTGKWFIDRFIFKASKIEIGCKFCGRKIYLPSCKAGKYKTCGGVCAAGWRNKIKTEQSLSRGFSTPNAERMRCCNTCSTIFYPRLTQIKNGAGKFCSQKCNTAGRNAMHTKESREKAVKTFNESVASGKYKQLAGKDSPRYSGGAKASVARNKHKFAARLKKYRKENPEKVREFTNSRSRRKFGRLPKGTVLLIKTLQKNKCPICHISLTDGFHVDHIIPLKKGGLHEKRNIQILCPSCNVRKSAKDPIEFMQSRGFLL